MNTLTQAQKAQSLPESGPDLASRTAKKAQKKPRHLKLASSLGLLVVLPTLAAIAYLTVFAQPQYASNSGFVVRQEEGASASAMLGGLSQILGAQTAGNSDLLFEFIQSQSLVSGVQSELDILSHYSQTWPLDPIFSVHPEATIETLLRFWRRMVRITYDKSSGVIMVEVRARSPDMAYNISREIIFQSENMVNMLNATARRDSMANAQGDLEEAAQSLRLAREALIAFQARTQILDPQADIQGRMGVVASLQQQLAQALVDYDLLIQSASMNDPRVRQLDLRISTINERIAIERRSSTESDVTVDNTDFPTLLGQYERLRLDVQFAEENYRAALTALSQARTNAERKQVYLATFIAPTIAETAEYPKKALIVGLTAFFALMFWSVGALVYYSLRDRG
ncbi:sugar transporter [Roseinatronobacter monicus]|uniref:Capsular polysaccharide transport system permease protein n=1 Tax=Roseinatronobacter monicus TaxID=393481 RepID=A0A543K5J9_9RHOB|nr:sugar transporter [Roseinatronobacter monicus]TQM90351.1 capsular polysaccharide transport system permease protein [Roseinatronobacter monicus]